MSDDVLAVALSNRGLIDENARLRSENEALTAQTTALSSIKKEVQEYLDANFQRFVEMKAALEDMERRWDIISEKPKKTK